MNNDITTLIEELNGGIWPVDACLRWNTREDMCVESELESSEYAHEIRNIKNDGAWGWEFDAPMSRAEIEQALDFIATNAND